MGYGEAIVTLHFKKRNSSIHPLLIDGKLHNAIQGRYIHRHIKHEHILSNHELKHPLFVVMNEFCHCQWSEMICNNFTTKMFILPVPSLKNICTSADIRTSAKFINTCVSDDNSCFCLFC